MVRAWLAWTGCCLLASSLLLLGGCRPFSQADGSTQPAARQDPYRDDERWRLHMALEDILNLEQQKNYGRIYDLYTSQPFRRAVDRRDFLRMAQCTETHLGPVQHYDAGDDHPFHRKQGKKGTFDTTLVRVQRGSSLTDERFVFLLEGVDFKLSGLFWQSSNEGFIGCMKQVANLPSRMLTPEGTEILPPAPPPAAEATSPSQPEASPNSGPSRETKQRAFQKAVDRPAPAPTSSASSGNETSPPTPPQGAGTPDLPPSDDLPSQSAGPSQQDD
jgi:hypothetical protein